MTTTGNLLTLAKHFTDEAAATAELESLRWPNGVACPRHVLKAGPMPKQPKVKKGQKK